MTYKLKFESNRYPSIRLAGKWGPPGAEAEFNQHTMFVDVSFDIQTAETKPVALFMAGSKDGTALKAWQEDVSILISIALQHGACPHRMLKTLHGKKSGDKTLAAFAVERLVIIMKGIE